MHRSTQSHSPGDRQCSSPETHITPYQWIWSIFKLPTALGPLRKHNLSCMRTLLIMPRKFVRLADGQCARFIDTGCYPVSNCLLCRVFFQVQRFIAPVCWLRLLSPTSSCYNTIVLFQNSGDISANNATPFPHPLRRLRPAQPIKQK